jgi:hypothetical protein
MQHVKSGGWRRCLDAASQGGPTGPGDVPRHPRTGASLTFSVPLPLRKRSPISARCFAVTVKLALAVRTLHYGLSSLRFK